MGFIPDIEKSFPFKAGDVLLRKGKWSITKILRVKRIDVKQGDVLRINAADVKFPEDDFLLLIFWVRGSSFESEAQARLAVEEKNFGFGVNAVTRPSGIFPQEQIKVAKEEVNSSELEWFSVWEEKWAAGEFQIP